MKKIVALLLSLVLLAPVFAGCSSSPKKEPTESKTDESVKTEETEDQTGDLSKIPEENRLSKKKIASFPIANSSMTEEELRKLCVDFFRFSQSFAWTPDEDWMYGKNAENPTKVLKAGNVYGGFPYVLGTGNVYRIAEFYDEATGVVNMSGAGANQRHFGNFCSYGSGWGFSRVVNSAAHKLTKDMVPKNGYVPLGSYKMDLELDELGKNATVDICTANGEEVMYQSYACLKPADALVNFSSGGHVIMCADVKIVNKADGSINPDKSYITYLDQGSSWSFHQMENGKRYQVQGGVDKTYTFSKLFKKNYIPYTFAEFLGTDPVENGKVSLEIADEPSTVTQLSQGTVCANYMISDVFLDILNQSGKVVESRVIRTSNGGVKAVKLTAFGEDFPLQYADSNHTVRITCQIGNGEKLTVWEGKLLAQ